MARKLYFLKLKRSAVWCILAAVATLLGSGCAPQKESARTPLVTELAIARMSAEKTGRIGEVCAGLAESLAAWRAHRVAELPLRTGWVRVVVRPEAGSAEEKQLVQLALPLADAIKAAEPDFLAAAGLVQATVETPDTVTIEMVLAVSSGEGCRLTAKIHAANAPDWQNSWSVVPDAYGNAAKPSKAESR